MTKWVRKVESYKSESVIKSGGLRLEAGCWVISEHVSPINVTAMSFTAAEQRGSERGRETPSIQHTAVNLQSVYIKTIPIPKVSFSVMLCWLWIKFKILICHLMWCGLLVSCYSSFNLIPCPLSTLWSHLFLVSCFLPVNSVCLTLRSSSIACGYTSLSKPCSWCMHTSCCLCLIWVG